MRTRVIGIRTFSCAAMALFFAIQTAQGIGADAAFTVQNGQSISYKVRMPKPWTHLIEVEMEISRRPVSPRLDIKMAVWTPGSYLVREYARHVQDLSVTGGEGQRLGWSKINKNTWRIETRGASRVKVSYKVYANELTVRTNELNSEHAFFTPAALLMYPKGSLKAPSTVTVIPYGNWKVATGLPPVAGRDNTFRAPDYDTLFDSPFEVSDFVERKFDVRGIPHRYVITGEGNYDLDRMVADTKKIIEQTYEVFGELPYKDYTFLLNLRGGGGLEHLNSTALQFNRFGFKPDSRYSRFLGLVAHEYFHLFNVKRIRPDALGPFDYENENYTKLLWVAEGATSYYQSVVMRRAGLISDKSFLAEESSIIENLHRQPGRFETSLEEASFDAWIKFYRRDENGINNQISYYSKGELVNFLLDLKIRAGSAGRRSLDDVMRTLYNDYFKKGKNFTPEDYQRISEEMAGGGLDGFFGKYVRGRAEIDYNSILGPFGLKLKKEQPENDKAYFGARLSSSGGALRVSAVPADSPAYSSGVNAGDEIVAVDGYRANRQFLSYYFGLKKAGDSVKLSVFRHGKLIALDITLGRTPASGFRIVKIKDAAPSQKRLLEGLFR